MRLYTVLLWLYPRQFRQDFAAEMQTVFSEALRCACREGLWAMLRLCSREVRQLPRALGSEFWQSVRERQAGMVKGNGRMTHRMMTPIRKPERGFYQGWVVFSAISIPIAGGIAFPLISLAKVVVGDTIQVGGITRITEDYLLAPIFLIALGLLTGLWQRLLLHSYLPRMGWWIAATVSGMVLGFVGRELLFSVFHNSIDTIWFGILATMLCGGFMGLPQWLLLRQRVRHASWWILANALGWGIFGWGAMIVNNFTIPALGMFLLPGIATSLALWLLLDRLPQHDGRGKNQTPNEAQELTH